MWNNLDTSKKDDLNDPSVCYTYPMDGSVWKITRVTCLRHYEGSFEKHISFLLFKDFFSVSVFCFDIQVFLKNKSLNFTLKDFTLKNSSGKTEILIYRVDQKSWRVIKKMYCSFKNTFLKNSKAVTRPLAISTVGKRF